MIRNYYGPTFTRLWIILPTIMFDPKGFVQLKHFIWYRSIYNIRSLAYYYLKTKTKSKTHTPWIRLWMLTVYSRVTTSLMAERPFFLSVFFTIQIHIKMNDLAIILLNKIKLKIKKKPWMTWIIIIIFLAEHKPWTRSQRERRKGRAWYCGYSGAQLSRNSDVQLCFICSK